MPGGIKERPEDKRPWEKILKRRSESPGGAEPLVPILHNG
jgi:hypothetical protein